MNKKALSYLVALTILFQGASTVVAETENLESFETIEQKILNEQDYNSLNFDSIFNMTEEESKKEEFFERISVLPLFYKGIKLLIPVINVNKTVVFEENEKNNDNNTILFDDLKNINNNLSSTDLKKLIDASYGSTEEYVELSTGKSIGYGFLESNQYLLNYDFFENFVSKE